MFATTREDLGHLTEIATRDWNSGDTAYVWVNRAHVIYQYDESLSNPYHLVDGEVLMHHPNHGLFIADSIDLDFEGEN
tara:strand:- start:93 stop:326 length:234 start_codon:yes stop_codon:yes gene_type:complete